jgi:hypothetical protein
MQTIRKCSVQSSSVYLAQIHCASDSCGNQRLCLYQGVQGKNGLQYPLASALKQEHIMLVAVSSCICVQTRTYDASDYTKPKCGNILLYLR